MRLLKLFALIGTLTVAVAAGSRHSVQHRIHVGDAKPHPEIRHARDRGVAGRP